MRPIIQGHPTVACIICTKPTPMLGTKLCDQCWELRNRVECYATRLLKDPKAAPQVRALLEDALKTQVQPPTEAAE